MKSSKLTIITQEIFYVFSGALVMFITLEIICPRLIINYFNINYLVILWLISAVSMLRSVRHS
jgi:hypothetical protein